MHSQYPEESRHLVELPKKKKWFWRWWGILLILTAIVLVGAVTAFGIKVFSLVQEIKSGEDIGILFSGQELEAGFDDNLVYGDKRLVLGSQKARISAAVFIDFKCDACRQKAETLRNILIADKYRDKVSFVIRHFPIVDPQESSRYTALAVECANEQGFFTEMFYKIFGGSVQADKIDLRKYAAEIGADNMQFSACLETEKYFANVNQDFIDAVKLRLNGTPAMFLGGELFEGYLGQNEIEKILDILLIQQ